eukprot:6191591-Pleurochrysis_carterae.AAC.1
MFSRFVVKPANCVILVAVKTAKRLTNIVDEAEIGSDDDGKDAADSDSDGESCSDASSAKPIKKQ